MKNLNYKFEGWYKQTHWMSPKLTLRARGDYDHPVVQNMYTAYRAGFNRANKERREMYSADAAVMKQALNVLEKIETMLRNKYHVLPDGEAHEDSHKAIATLRERLGEKA